MTLASVKKTSLGTLNLNANTLNITTFDSSGTGQIDVNNGILICPLMSGTYGISSGATLQPISTGCNNASILHIAGMLDCSSLTDLTAQLPDILNFYNGSKLKINGGLTFGKNINIQTLNVKGLTEK